MPIFDTEDAKEGPKAFVEAITLRKEDVPYAPILDFFEVETDPQIVHMQTFYTSDHPQLGTVRGIQSPVWCDRTREVPNLPPPVLGQHTDEQAALAGFTDTQIAELRANKAI